MKDKRKKGQYWFHILQDNSIDRIYRYRWIVGVVGQEVGFSRGGADTMWGTKSAIKRRIRQHKNPKCARTWEGTL